MNCREAQSQMFAERDGAQGISPRAELESHVAHCAACRHIRDDLAAALATWRADVSQATVPDPEREWHAVRRRIRGAGDASHADSRPRRHWLAWITLPLGAAAAVAVAIMVSLPRPPSGPVAAFPEMVAHADWVEAPGRDASTMVFVDEKSGWLIVWASDAHHKQG